MSLTNNMKPEKIKNMSGTLCRSFDGSYFFRKTESDGTFRDFALAHSDLEIKIQDDDAYIYESDGRWFIDHSPATLGRT